MDGNIIERTLDSWTEGDMSPRSRVKVFNRIREIPYAVVQKQLNARKGPLLMLKSRRGSCLPKHYLMGDMLERLGIRTRYCVFTFRWSDLELVAPQAVVSLGQRIPVTYHLACEALPGDRWVLLDATWDDALKGAGFPVNDSWDGHGDTALAVPPLDKTVFENAAECDRWIKKRYSGYTLTDKLELSRFSIEFNRWLVKVRNGSGWE
jgi:hypothetical protein